MRWAIYLGLILLLASGCSDNREKPTAGKAPDTPTERPSVSVEGPRSSGAGGFTVTILPKEPTARDDLYLVFSGQPTVGSCSWERNGAAIETSDCSRLPKHSFVKGDEIRVRVAADGEEASASVTIVNAPPEVVAVPFKDPYVHRGVDIEVLPEGADIDGDSVQFHYLWRINGEDVSLDAPTLPGDRFRKGDHISLSIVPFDGEDEGSAYRGREFVIPNAPPSFTSTPPLQFKSGVYRYQATAEDADDDMVRFSLESAPDGMTIDSDTGQVVWPVGKDQVGEHRIAIAAEDQEGARALQNYAVTISIEE